MNNTPIKRAITLYFSDFQMIDQKKIIKVFCIVFCIAVNNSTHAAKGADVVSFKSIPFTYAPTAFALKRAKKLGKNIEPKIEPAVSLSGYLKRPEGEEPLPAIVLLHTCAGISEHERSWLEILASWGYVVLLVDSLTPRGVGYICDGRAGSIAPWNRALDAYGGKKFLSNLPYVDADRIAVLGLSHGGMAVMDIVKSDTSSGIDMKPFRAAIALYPLCGEPVQIDIPTLILIGDKDSWTPADLCKQLFQGLGKPKNVTLKVIENAYHLFDHPKIDITDLGYILRTNPEARDQAIRMVREFLVEMNN